MEGQYIIKNLLIISGALVIGGTVHKIDEVPDKPLNTDAEDGVG